MECLFCPPWFSNVVAHNQVRDKIYREVKKKWRTGPMWKQTLSYRDHGILSFCLCGSVYGNGFKCFVGSPPSAQSLWVVIYQLDKFFLYLNKNKESMHVKILCCHIHQSLSKKV